MVARQQQLCVLLKKTKTEMLSHSRSHSNKLPCLDMTAFTSHAKRAWSHMKWTRAGTLVFTRIKWWSMNFGIRRAGIRARVPRVKPSLESTVLWSRDGCDFSCFNGNDPDLMGNDLHPDDSHYSPAADNTQHTRLTARLFSGFLTKLYS